MRHGCLCCIQRSSLNSSGFHLFRYLTVLRGIHVEYLKSQDDIAVLANSLLYSGDARVGGTGFVWDGLRCWVGE